MNMVDAVKSGFEHSFNWKGRASRPAFWWLYLATLILAYVPILIGAAIGGAIGALFTIIGVLLALSLVLATLSTMIRRLHDTGKSGWWYWVGLIPCIGTIWLIILLATDSDAGPNQYGPNPQGGVSGSDGVPPMSQPPVGQPPVAPPPPPQPPAGQ